MPRQEKKSTQQTSRNRFIGVFIVIVIIVAIVVPVVMHFQDKKKKKDNKPAVKLTLAPATKVFVETTTISPTIKVVTTTMTPQTTTTTPQTTTMKPQTITTISPVLTTTRSPLPTTDLSIWLDSTVSSSWSGAQWKNLSPNSTGNAVPLFGTWSPSDLVSNTINGLPGLYFNGSRSLSLQQPAGTYSKGFTLFIVFRSTTSNTDAILASRTTLSGVASPFTIYNNQFRIGNGSASNGYTGVFNLNSLSITVPYIYTFRVYPNDPRYASTYKYTYSIWMNSTKYPNQDNVYVSSSSANEYNDTASAFYLGAQADSKIGFNAYIGEVIMYKKALSDTEVPTIITYLQNKWKIV